VTKLSKIWVWDPGSEIRDTRYGKSLFRIPDPGVKKQWIQDPDPQHCKIGIYPGVGSSVSGAGSVHEHPIILKLKE
jgi:hypothetical protein